MKLQIALDVKTIKEAVDIVKEVHDYIDIIEAGMVSLYCGLDAVKSLKEHFPDLEVLADLKTMDGGYGCSKAAFEYGADYATVAGVAGDNTILGGIKAGKEFNRKIVVDMISTKNFNTRVKEVDDMGVDIICVHTAYDVYDNSDATPLGELQLAKKIVKNAKISVAGGISFSTIEDIISLNPDIVVIGGAIVGSNNMKETAKRFSKIIRN